MNESLPNSWTETTIGDLFEFTYGKSLPDRVRSGKGFPVFGSNGVVGFHDNALTQGETIIIGRKGSVGEVNYSPSPCFPIDTTYYIEQFKGMPAKFWFYRLKFANLGTLNKATAIPGLNRNDAYSVSIALPPIPEQKRIADKLDSLLARVEQCQTHLDRLPHLLKAFRQSVLAAATSGQLTEEWRNGNETNWETHPLGSLCSRVSVGHVGITSKYYTTAEEGIPFLRSQNVRPGRVDLSGLVYITREFHEHLKKSQLKAGDLLIVRVGANRGDTCVLPSGFTEINCANIVFARPTKILPAYLGIYFQSPLVQEEMLGKAVGGAQEVVNTKMIEQINVLVPPIAEQHEIVRRVERLFAFAERLETRWRAAQGQVSALTPSLLAKAFRGELV